jgi:hypothetical protein
MLKLVKYMRNPFVVEAIQVTEENIKEVAVWCQGEVITLARRDGEAPCIKVRVHRPLNDRQTRAFVGDWILHAGSGFKVYTDKAFKDCFQLSTV